MRQIYDQKTTMTFSRPWPWIQTSKWKKVMGVWATFWSFHEVNRTTLCLKKTCDHISMISWRRTVCLQRFLHAYYQEYWPSTRSFSFPPHPFSAATLPWETVETYITNLALNCWFSKCYNTRILTAKLSPYYFTYLLHILWFKIKNNKIYCRW